MRCQLPSGHAQAHRYMDAAEAVMWSSSDLVAAFRSGSSTYTAAKPARRWSESIPAPGRILLPLIASHFGNRTEPGRRRRRSAPRHRAS